jgi:hypothetical protein
MGPDQLFSDGLEKRFGAGGTRVASDADRAKAPEDPVFFYRQSPIKTKGAQ